MLAVASRVLRRGKDRADEQAAQTRQKRAKVKPDERQLGFDLFMQITYMAALATAKVSRDVLFARAAELRLSSTPYFRDVQTLASRLSVDYGKACQIIAERTKPAAVEQLLLRMAGSLASGEDEAEFLTREAGVLAEQYGEKYERDIESLKKWTDAYTALVVSAGLIVIVSIISMMIYNISTSFLVIVAFAAISATSLGGWIIYLSSPKEAFARVAGLSSRDQRRAIFLFKAIFPASAVVAALMLLVGAGLGVALVIIGVSLLPAGFMMNRDAKKIAKRDQDVAVLVRLLGGVTAAIGTTPTQALGKIDQRSMKALEPEIAKLEIRLRAGLKTELCWHRFVEDNGSELIDRTVKIFSDALNAGGEPAAIGEKASFFAQRVTLLREKRVLVASTFSYLVPPMHASVIGLLVFIVNVLALFSSTLVGGAPETPSSFGGQPVPGLGVTAFATLDLGFLNALVTVTAVMMTVVNGFVVSVVNGGHWLRMAYGYAQMTLITGAMMAVLPGFATSMFATITENSG